jgi:hypothetical protein
MLCIPYSIVTCFTIAASPASHVAVARNDTMRQRLEVKDIVEHSEGAHEGTNSCQAHAKPKVMGRQTNLLGTF